MRFVPKLPGLGGLKLLATWLKKGKEGRKTFVLPSFFLPRA